MPLTLQPEEPPAGPWHPTPVADFATRLLATAPTPITRPLLIAIDGRSASGKTTLTSLLRAVLPTPAVIHTDALCWNEPLFAWEHLLHDVLTTLRRGAPLDFVPPAWPRHDRPGSITVPPGHATVLIEGIGSSHRHVADLLDVRIWVQSDDAVAERRGIARDIEDGTNGDPTESERFWFEWITAERRFLAQDRPWERVHWVVTGTPPTPMAPDTVAVTPGPLLP